MARGDKSKYTDKQKRQAEHIEEGYEARGVPAKEAKRRAWATENKMSGGGRKGGKLGGKATAARGAKARSASAKKAAKTRARHQAAKS